MLKVHFVSFYNSSNEWAVCDQLHQEKNEYKFSPVFPVATLHVNGCRFVSYILAIILSYILSGLFMQGGEAVCHFQLSSSI